MVFSDLFFKMNASPIVKPTIRTMYIMCQIENSVISGPPSKWNIFPPRRVAIPPSKSVPPIKIRASSHHICFTKTLLLFMLFFEFVQAVEPPKRTKREGYSTKKRQKVLFRKKYEQKTTHKGIAKAFLMVYNSIIKS